MANEFKVRKGLVVNGSGSVILDIQGSQGQLFSVTDQLSGSLFSVNDISGVPVLEAFSDSTVKIGQYLAEAIIVSGSTARITGSMSLAGFSTGSVLFAGTGGAISQNNSNFFWDNTNSRLGIGTNAPDSTLSVNGQVRFGNTTNGFYFSSNSISTFGNIFLGLQSDRYFSITDNSFSSVYFRVIKNTGAILIGTTVDDGVNRLQVSGSTRFIGDMVITGSSTFNGNITLLANISSTTFGGFIQAGNTFSFYSSNGNINGQNLLSINNNGNAFGVGLSRTSNITLTSGGTNWLTINSTSVAFAPTSGTATMNGIGVSLIISQSGDANGITRGLYVAPTLTSAWDFRAIEWTNNASATSGSWGLYGAGTAPNFLSGSLGIGITTPSSSIHINSSTVSNAFLITTPNNNTTLYPFFIGGVTLTSDVYLRANSSIIEFRRNGNPSTIRTVGASNNLALEGSQHIVFSTNGANERARFTSGGNLLLNDTVDDTFNRLQVSGSTRISQALTASLALISGSGSQRLTVQGSGSSILTVDGALGRLFSVDDAASGSLFSVNTISGLPIMEAFSDNTVRIGQFGQRALFVSQSRVGIGKEDSLNATLDVSGSMALTGSFNHQGNYTTTGVITAQTLVISTISSSVVYSSGSNVFGNSLSNTQVLTGSVSITGSLTSNGDVVIRGSGATAATIALAVQNSSSIPILILRNDAEVLIGNNSWLAIGNGQRYFYRYLNNTGIFSIANDSTTSAVINLYGSSHATKPTTTEITSNFAPTSGTIQHSTLALLPTINQTGGANGITRGLYISPILTAAADWRSIEWSNNTGWGLYGAGSAPNYLSGSLGIGTTTPSASIDLGGAGSRLRFSQSGSTSIFTGIEFATNGSVYGSLLANQNTGEIRLTALTSYFPTFWSSGAEAMRISTNRNLLINSTTDDTFNRLQVSGSARISQTLTASQALISGSGTQRLTVVGSGSAQPLFTVQGSQGELFSIVDSLSGSLFSVNDQSGLPIMEVFSDNTILMGNYLNPMLLTTTKTGSAAGINTIYSLPTSSYDAVYIDYTIRSGSNARAGNFMAMWSGTSVNFTDNSITEFGSTSTFTFGAHVSGANMVVTGSAPTAGWTIKTIIKAI